jgi:cardiolipin synthase
LYAHYTGAPDTKLCTAMSLRANTIHCMRISTGLLARTAVVAVAASAISTSCAFAPTLATPHIAGIDSTVPYRLIQEPDAGYQPIIDLIHTAVSSVRMTMYELDDNDAVEALIDAHHRGVDVKVILDTAFHGHATNPSAPNQLQSSGVAVRWAPNDVIYHQKTIAVDHTLPPSV